MAGGGGTTNSQTSNQTWDPGYYKGSLQHIADANEQVFGRFNQQGDLNLTSPVSTFTPYTATNLGARGANATQAFAGAPPSHVEAMYGLSPGSLQYALSTGVTPLSNAGQMAQQYGTAAGSMPLSALFGQSQNALGQNLAELGQGTWQGIQGLEATARGDMYGRNPYLDQTYAAASRPLINQFQSQIMPGIQSAFDSGGRYGSGAQSNALGNAADSLGSSLGQLGSSIYGGDYSLERQLQSAAQGQLAGGTADLQRGAALAPMLGAAPSQQLYNQAQMLGTTGSVEQGITQQLLANALQNYQMTQQQPLNQLQTYANFALAGPQAGTGSLTSTIPTQSPQTNPWATTGGGALAGAGAGAAIGAPFGGIGAPIGAGIGAIAGGLMGYLGSR